MQADDFVRELAPLRAFGSAYISTSLLEELESTGLLRPIVRIRYPDAIARRFWLVTHEETPCQVTLPIEPDGPRWDAAIDLSNALYRRRSSFTYRLAPHPLDDPEPRFAEFIKHPTDFVFERRMERRVDVSNDVYGTLFSDCNVDDYYSSWQILLAAEVADAGVHIRINLADENLSTLAEEIRHGRIPERTQHSFNIRAIHAAQDFSKHQNALDAVVWFAEEWERVLAAITMEHRERRFRLTPSERARYDQSGQDLARASIDRFRVCGDDLTALIRFLGEYWSHWDREGRPRIADAYKAYMARAVELAGRIENLTFADLRDRIGRVHGPLKPILDVVWPDWSDEEKRRARLTLKGSTGSEKPGGLVVSDVEIEAFVEFLAQNGLEAFFWRLNSFENHALRGNQFSLQGMKSDIQGMAIVVEHVAEALGGTETQLYEKFKQLWRDPDVLEILRRNDISPLARTAQWGKNWPSLKNRINALCNEPGGEAAADLVMAHRIRGGVHSAFPEDDHLELEALFVGLMRAALRTFVEVSRRNPTATIDSSAHRP